MKKRLVVGIALAGVCLVYFRMQIVGMDAVLKDGVRNQDKVCEPKIRYTLGHRGEILSLAFSPDGSQLATASTDGSALICDAATGEKKQTLKHDRAVTWVVWSHDSKRIATGSWDKSACIWDAQSGQPLVCFRYDDMVYGVAFSPGDDMLLVAAGKVVHALNIEIKMPQFDLLHTAPVSSIAWSADGRIATSCGSDVTLWSGADGSKQKEFKNKGHAHVSGFSSSGNRLLTIAGYKAILLNVDTLNKSSWGDSLSETGIISAAAFDSNSGIVLGIGSMALICDVATGAVHNRLEQSGKINAIAVSPNGSLLAISCGRNQVAVWDLHCQS